MTDDSLLLEIGNTTIKLAQLAPDGVITIKRFDAPELLVRRLCDTDRRIICAPVGDSLSQQVIAAIAREHRLHVIVREELSGFIGASYDTPETLGIDRVLNLLGLGGDGIAISCGTAITVDAVAGGKPMWGAIMPGFRTAAAGLHERIPTLPLVEPDAEVGMPARTSHQSVANGVVLGSVLAVQELAGHLASHCFVGGTPRVVLTGGDADVLRRLWNGGEMEVDDALLFRGMIAVVDHIPTDKTNHRM